LPSRRGTKKEWERGCPRNLETYFLAILMFNPSSLLSSNSNIYFLVNPSFPVTIKFKDSYPCYPKYSIFLLLEKWYQSYVRSVYGDSINARLIVQLRIGYKGNFFNVTKYQLNFSFSFSSEQKGTLVSVPTRKGA